MLHAVLYSILPNIRCIVHLNSPAAVAVSGHVLIRKYFKYGFIKLFFFVDFDDESIVLYFE